MRKFSEQLYLRTILEESMHFQVTIDVTGGGKHSWKHDGTDSAECAVTVVDPALVRQSTTNSIWAHVHYLNIIIFTTANFVQMH